MPSFQTTYKNLITLIKTKNVSGIQSCTSFLKGLMLEQIDIMLRTVKSFVTKTEHMTGSYCKNKASIFTFINEETNYVD